MVSIVMGTYNGADFLAQQLSSIAAQTLQPEEMVVADDGSRDKTLEIVAAFAATSTFPVRFFSNPTHLGWSDNFLNASTKASGDLIAFADQDDVWLPTKLERMVPSFDDLTVSAVICADTETHGDLTPIPRRRHTGVLFRDGLHGPWASAKGNCMVIRSAALSAFPGEGRAEKVDGGPETYDGWAVFAAQTFGRIVLVPEPLVLHRRHAAAATREHADRSRLALITAPGLETLRAQAKSVAGRRDYLRERRKVLEGSELAAMTAAAAGRYDRFAQLTQERVELWEASGRWVRARRLATTTLCGGYRSQRGGGLGLAVLAQDVRILNGR